MSVMFLVAAYRGLVVLARLSGEETSVRRRFRGYAPSAWCGRRLDLPVPARVGGHTDPRRCTTPHHTTPHHTDPRRCTHAARQPIQGHAIVVTHTFHAQEPNEPRVPAKLLRHLLSGSLPRGRALLARAYFRVALLPLPAKHVSGGVQDRTGGVTSTLLAITPLLRGCTCEQHKERERQNSGECRIMCPRCLGHHWPAVESSSSREPLQ